MKNSSRNCKEGHETCGFKPPTPFGAKRPRSRLLEQNISQVPRIGMRTWHSGLAWWRLKELVIDRSKSSMLSLSIFAMRDRMFLQPAILVPSSLLLVTTWCKKHLDDEDHDDNRKEQSKLERITISAIIVTRMSIIEDELRNGLFNQPKTSISLV